MGQWGLEVLNNNLFLNPKSAVAAYQSLVELSPIQSGFFIVFSFPGSYDN